MYNFDIFDYFEFEIVDDPRSSKDIIIDVFNIISLVYDKSIVINFFNKNVKLLQDRHLYAFVLNYIQNNRNLSDLKEIIDSIYKITIDDIKAITIQA
jgi:hypothetical protein